MVLPNIAPEGEHSADQPPVLSKCWSVSISEIVSSVGTRLDARHFNPAAANAVETLRDTGLDLQPLSRLADVQLPSQFTRIWAKDREHGLPYLNATDLLSLMALGVPAGGPRYLSHATNTDMKRLVIHKGTLLMSCSGTIGRVFYVPERLDGWVATHDLIRIVPNESQMTGFLHAYLSTTLAQEQILSHTHGGQIDHVTDLQVGSCLVPIPGDNQIKHVGGKVLDALSLREQAIEVLTNAWTIT